MGEWLTGKIIGVEEPELATHMNYDEDMLTIEYTKTDASGKEVKGTRLLQRKSKDLEPLPVPVAKPQSRPSRKQPSCIRTLPPLTETELALANAVTFGDITRSTDRHGGTRTLRKTSSGWAKNWERRRLTGEATIDRLIRETREMRE